MSAAGGLAGAGAPRWLARTTDAGVGCYVHIPFCDRICPYCDFAVVRLRDAAVGRYLDALAREIESSPRTGPLQTLYLGGGTPSTLAPDALRRLLAATFAKFATPADGIECTLEANPSRAVEHLGAWREAGVNRLSIGVQSFDDEELDRLGRDHTAAQAAAFCRAARAAGFTNVSVDLIAGVPGHTNGSPEAAASFEHTLSTALSLGVDHISVYGLTVEETTPYAAWRRRDPAAFPDDDVLAELLERAHAVLTTAGYQHYEISNFARPGHESAHNTGYWRQRECLAFGMSAAGYEDGVRYRNHADFATYCAAIEAGGSARSSAERLDRSARMGEAAMLALRTAGGLDDEDFRERFGVRASDAFAAAVKKCMAAGLLERDAHGARLTGRGRLLANSVCAEFLEPQPTLSPW